MFNHRMVNGGFMPTSFPPAGAPLPPSRSLMARFEGIILPQELQDNMAALERGEFAGDMQQLMVQFQQTMLQFGRSITSTTSNLPIRENLEAEAKILTPQDTPLRNRLPRVLGAGTAAAWRQVTSLGGGYGLSTTITVGANSATQQVGSTAGMQAGKSVFIGGATNLYRVVSSVTDATHVVFTASVNTTTADAITAGPYFQPGGDAAAVRSFFAESGAPAQHATTYASKSASYKLLGTYFDITGFAMAAGANFQNQYAMEKTNAIRNLMLNEENALWNGDSTITAAPWGDGSNALAFDGLLTQTSTANGTPTVQVQTAVGALTTAHMDAQLARQWNQGMSGPWIAVSAQESLSLVHLAEASGTLIRVMATSDADAILGVKLIGYKHPITGEVVPILVSRFIPAGTMFFGADRLADGSPAIQVDVLPQVQLPELAPNDNVQGYVAQELAPTTSAPQVYPGIVTVFETLKLKSALVVCKSTGLTAV